MSGLENTLPIVSRNPRVYRDARLQTDATLRFPQTRYFETNSVIARLEVRVRLSTAGWVGNR